MANDNDIHPVVIISCFVMLGITIGAAVAMKKLPFSTSLETKELEAEDLLYRSSLARSLSPVVEVK